MPATTRVPVIENLASCMSQLREFLLNPVPKGTLLKCTITRNKKGMNKIYPKYFLQMSDNSTFLMAGKKRPLKYLISGSAENIKTKSSDYLGKVVNNMVGTIFRIYDNGVDPKKSPYNTRYIREELGIITYKSNIVGKKGPRKMKILIPQVSS